MLNKEMKWKLRAKKMTRETVSERKRVYEKKGVKWLSPILYHNLHGDIVKINP